MFHAKNGLCFDKKEDGSVEVYYEGVPNFSITLTANEWASVIATMSHYGEVNYGFYRALGFHTGAPLDPAIAPIVETKLKSLGNSDISGAKQNVKDLKVVGNGDAFKLLCKVYSQAEGWMKSTKAYEIQGVGCIVQVTTQQGSNVAEAVTFVPGVEIIEDENGGRKLYPIS